MKLAARETRGPGKTFVRSQITFNLHLLISIYHYVEILEQRNTQPSVHAKCSSAAESTRNRIEARRNQGWREMGSSTGHQGCLGKTAKVYVFTNLGTFTFRWLYSDSVAHESSYLPFLFPSEREDIATSTPKPRGRRTFNKHGLDVSQDRSQPQLERVNLLRLFHANIILICVSLERCWWWWCTRWQRCSGHCRDGWR